MALSVTVLSGFTATSGFTLERSNAPFVIALPVSFSAVQVIPQFTTVDVTQAASGQYGSLARPDGSGLAFIATSGAGPTISSPINPPAPWMRLIFSAAPTVTVTATILTAFTHR